MSMTGQSDRCERGRGQPERATRIAVLATCVAALAIVVRLPFLQLPGFGPDQAQFILWSLAMQPGEGRAGGVAAAYEPVRRPATAPRAGGPGGASPIDAGREPGPGGVLPSVEERPLANYPPGYLYVLRVLPQLGPAEAEQLGAARDIVEGRATDRARRMAALHKWPGVLADALTGALLCVVLARRMRLRWGAGLGACYVLMPAGVYDSAVWGQVDGIHTLLMVASLELAARQRIAWMCAAAALAALFKAQALLLAPLWAVVLVDWARADGARWGKALLATAIPTALLLWPVRDALGGVWVAYAGAASQYPFVHLNGFSLWFLVAPVDDAGALATLKGYVPDSARYLGVPARLWGMGCLVATWVFVAVALWRQRMRCANREKPTAQAPAAAPMPEEGLRWAARVLPLAFFVLSTQMHERYLFPAIALWAWGMERNWRWAAGWMAVGLIAAVNMMWVWCRPVDARWAAIVRGMLESSGSWPGRIGAAIVTLTLLLALMERVRGRLNHSEIREAPQHP